MYLHSCTNHLYHLATAALTQCCSTSEHGMRHGDELQDDSWEEMAKRPRNKRVRRSSSFSSLESMRNISTAGDVIRAAGYPLEEHTVTTSDGYIQKMERIPRHGRSLTFVYTSSAQPWILCCRRSRSCCLPGDCHPFKFRTFRWLRTATD